LTGGLCFFTGFRTLKSEYRFRKINSGPISIGIIKLKGSQMTRHEANRIHSYFDAAFKLAILFSGVTTLLAMSLGMDFANVVAVLGGSMAFYGIMASLSTDMLAKRIPNPLSTLTLASAPVWWIAILMGSDIATGAGSSSVMDAMSLIGIGSGQGSLIPSFDVSVGWQIGLDITMMALVFLPLLASFTFGLGFGGGDVKLMTAAALFLGWPLGFDFLILTFMFGGLISAPLLLGRKFCRIAVYFGKATDGMTRFSMLREFPYAPAITVAAIFCLSAKFEGFL
jgi:Flp pilus assembly protein protease CpaA